jgi:hypothetical protein
MKTGISMTLIVFCIAGCGMLETRPTKISKTYSPPSEKISFFGDNEKVGAPAFIAGQQWTYRRIDHWKKREVERFRQELFFPDEKLWIVRWSILNSDKADRMGSVTGELFNPLNHSFADASMSGAYEPLHFPLTKGKSWSFDYSIPSKNLRVSQTATVRGWEQVTVPAGKFRAIRITHEGYYSAKEAVGDYSWTGQISETYWYAPEIKRVVKREYQDTKGDGLIWDQWRDELVDMKL